MPGSGQPSPPSGNVTASADTTVTWSGVTPARPAASVTTGPMMASARSTGPVLAFEAASGDIDGSPWVALAVGAAVAAELGTVLGAPADAPAEAEHPARTRMTAKYEKRRMFDMRLVSGGMARRRSKTLR